MKHDVSFKDFVGHLSGYGISQVIKDKTSPFLINERDALLEKELDSMKLRADTADFFKQAKDIGLDTAIISNLTQAYGKRLLSLLDDAKVPVDHIAFSYQVGAKKPERKIFQHIADAAKVEITEILMI